VEVTRCKQLQVDEDKDSAVLSEDRQTYEPLFVYIYGTLNQLYGLLFCVSMYILTRQIISLGSRIVYTVI
jgi:hypothetical protein